MNVFTHYYSMRMGLSCPEKTFEVLDPERGEFEYRYPVLQERPAYSLHNVDAHNVNNTNYNHRDNILYNAAQSHT